MYKSQFWQIYTSMDHVVVFDISWIRWFFLDKQDKKYLNTENDNADTFYIYIYIYIFFFFNLMCMYLKCRETLK